MKAVVVGVGSRLGDDAVGPVIARALAAGPALPGSARAVAVERADLELLELLRDADLAVIVDALEGAGRPGRVRRLRPDELEAPRRPGSSHGLGVTGVLALAEALLGSLPRIEIVGVEIGRCDDWEGALSPPVARAVGPACRAIRALLAESTRPQGRISTTVSTSTRSDRKSMSASDSATQP